MSVWSHIKKPRSHSSILLPLSHLHINLVQNIIESVFWYFSNCLYIFIIIHPTLILFVPHFFILLDFENSSFSLFCSTNHYYLLSTSLYFLTSNCDQSLLYLNPSVTLIAFRMEFRFFLLWHKLTRILLLHTNPTSSFLIPPRIPKFWPKRATRESSVISFFVYLCVSPFLCIYFLPLLIS